MQSKVLNTFHARNLKIYIFVCSNGSLTKNYMMHDKFWFPTCKSLIVGLDTKEKKLKGLKFNRGWMQSATHIIAVGF